MHLAIIKNITNLEDNYFSLKMTAFLSLANYKSHAYEATKISKNRSI